MAAIAAKARKRAIARAASWAKETRLQAARRGAVCRGVLLRSGQHRRDDIGSVGVWIWASTHGIILCRMSLGLGVLGIPQQDL